MIYWITSKKSYQTQPKGLKRSPERTFGTTFFTVGFFAGSSSLESSSELEGGGAFFAAGLDFAAGFGFTVFG